MVAPSARARTKNPSILSRAASLMTGPIWVARSAGSPTTSPATAAVSAPTNSSYRLRGNSIRVSAAHNWPLLPITPATSPATVDSSGASGSTMAADFPPSSVLHRRIRDPHAAAIWAPTAVDPVKVTLSTPGCDVSACPVAAPPLTTFTTPSGSPASSIASVSTPMLSGASGAGLSTTVHPAASAGPSFNAAMKSGVFHGMIAPTTPTGS